MALFFGNSAKIVGIGNVIGYISSVEEEFVSLVKRLVISRIHMYIANILVAVL